MRLVAIYTAVALALLGGGGLAAAHMEDSDSFCASCHTQPESTFYQRSQAAPVDLASAHAAKGVACIACHSGPGVGGRVGAMTLGAKDLVDYIVGHYSSPAVLTSHIGDAYCLKCHGDIGSSDAFNNHFHTLLPKWQQLDPAHAATCADCHASHATGGELQIAFLRQAPTLAICQRCHAFAGEG